MVAAAASHKRNPLVVRRVNTVAAVGERPRSVFQRKFAFSDVLIGLDPNVRTSLLNSCQYQTRSASFFYYFFFKDYLYSFNPYQRTLSINEPPKPQKKKHRIFHYVPSVDGAALCSQSASQLNFTLFHQPQREHSHRLKFECAKCAEFDN